MQTKPLPLKRVLRTALVVLLLSVVGTTKTYAYDFSAVCETGQMLYYNITDASNYYVELTCPGSVYFDGIAYDYMSWRGFTKPIGDFTLPSIVDYNGVTYTVTSTSDYAFYRCSGLTSLTIPNSVTSIGDWAFSGCSGLTGDLIIPNSVISIGDWAFSGCSGLEQIIVDENNPNYDSRENCDALIETSTNTLILGCINTVIPNSVLSIGYGAFSGCSGLTGDLIIPNSVTSIGDRAFQDCSGLTGDLIIPDSVTSIGDWAFSGCSGFTGDLIISNSVTSIGKGAFCLDEEWYAAGSIPSPYIPEDDKSFVGSLTLGNSVTLIGDGAFYRRGFTGSLTIPNSVTLIGESAFGGCSGLTGDLIIPDSVTSIGDWAFSGCSGFTGSLTISNSVTLIEAGAFHGCSGFTGNLTIPNSVTTIGTSAFSGCSGLTSITVLADNPPTLGNNPFANVNRSIPLYVPCGSLGAYQSAAYWNEFTNIQEMCSQTQTITLSQGWNWLSTYVDVDDPVAMLQTIEAALGGNGVQIESFDDLTEFDGEEWYGGLDELGIQNEQTYLILTNTPRIVQLQGMPANPANHPITIYPGWNWIGFPCTQPLSVVAAFANFVAEDGDLLERSDAFTEFDDGEWYGEIETLLPGQGYMYYSNSTQTKILVFPVNAK